LYFKLAISSPTALHGSIRTAPSIHRLWLGHHHLFLIKLFIKNKVIYIRTDEKITIDK